MIRQIVRSLRARVARRRDAPAPSGAVYGHVIAPPRPTWAGVLIGLRLFALPALVFVLLLDLLVWAIAEALFGACVAIWCVI